MIYSFRFVSPRPLPEALLARTLRTLEDSGTKSEFRRGTFSWPEGEAAGYGALAYAYADVDLPDGLPPTGWWQEIKSLAIAMGVDCAAVPEPLSTRGVELIVSDVDSTFICGEVIDMLATYAGSAELVSQITEQAMRGELDFAQALRERVGTLAGVPTGAFEEIANGISFSPGATLLVERAHAHGARVGLVSGGFHEVVDLLGMRVGVDHVRANRLGVRDGKLDGTVAGPIVDREEKARALREWGTDLERCVAMGDGANDLSMMSLAGLSIGVAAKPKVREAVDVIIDQPQLATTALLLFPEGA